MQLLLVPVEQLLLLVGGRRQLLVDRQLGRPVGRRRRRLVELLLRRGKRRWRGKRIQRDERRERGQRLGRRNRCGRRSGREELLLDGSVKERRRRERLDGLVEEQRRREQVERWQPCQERLKLRRELRLLQLLDGRLCERFERRRRCQEWLGQGGQLRPLLLFAEPDLLSHVAAVEVHPLGGPPSLPLVLFQFSMMFLKFWKR